MKEIQIPRKKFARSSDPGTKRLKDSDMKNRKVAEKRPSAIFSDLSVESVKEPMDFTPISQISGAISDSEAESIIMQGPSLDLLSTPESISDLPASVQSLRAEINELKKLIYSVDISEESNWVYRNVTVKFRIVLFSFILWAILAAVVFFFSSGGKVEYHGPLPT